MSSTNRGGQRSEADFYPTPAWLVDRLLEAGDLTVKSTTNDKTYHNTDGGTLASGPGTTLDLTFEADEAGSESSAAAGEVDSMVTTLNLVTCASTTAATGTDAETAQSALAGEGSTRKTDRYAVRFRDRNVRESVRLEMPDDFLD